jgi:hypothetical protein
MMHRRLFPSPRVAGLLLILSFLLLLIGVGAVASQDKLRGMTVAFTGVGSLAKDASGLRTMLSFVIPSQIAFIIGLALFAAHQFQSADEGLALAGLALAIFSLALSAVEITFHASVTVWAAEHAPTVATTAQLFGPLRRWINTELQLTHVSGFLSAMLMFSLSTLRTATFPSWLRWIALAATILAALVYFRVQAAPAVIYISPLLFGIGLLLAGSRPQEKPNANHSPERVRAA